MVKKILVTGSSGFIGSCLTSKLLNDGQILFTILRNNKINKKKAVKIKKKYKNYHPIFFSKINQLKNKLSKLKIDVVVNLATKYLNKHNFKEMIELINSNILFTTVVLEALPKKKLKKYINLSTMTLYKNSYEYEPLNLYAATKKGFIDIIKFYQINFKKIKFYNISIYDTYGQVDKRMKIIPTLIKNYKLNKMTTVISKKLNMNLLNVNDICSGIKLLIEKNILAGNYSMRSKKFINIVDLVNKINKKLIKKIKLKILNKKVNKTINKKIKKIPFWKQTSVIEGDLLKYLNASR